MNKKKCQVCGSSHTVKNGIRNGVQLYKCRDCGYQFRAGETVSEDELWNVYQQEKQTIKELSVRFGMSVATVKRRLHGIRREWVLASFTWTPPIGDAVSVYCLHLTVVQGNHYTWPS